MNNWGQCLEEEEYPESVPSVGGDISWKGNPLGFCKIAKIIRRLLLGGCKIEKIIKTGIWGPPTLVTYGHPGTEPWRERDILGGRVKLK